MPSHNSPESNGPESNSPETNRPEPNSPESSPASAQAFSLTPIGFVRSCYPEKFGIPRQPNLAAATGIIRFTAPYDDPAAFEGLAHFSHIWVTFLFHLTPEGTWSPRIRPPRLGGNQRLGVFASRSPFRPNRLGLSVVRHHGLIQDPQGLGLGISAIDLVEGTPVFDIKPYLPYADALADATCTLGERPTPRLSVNFEPAALSVLRQLPGDQYPDLERLIVDTLGQDPRPAYRQGKPDSRQYGVKLFDLDVRFRVEEPCVRVAAIIKLD